MNKNWKMQAVFRSPCELLLIHHHFDQIIVFEGEGEGESEGANHLSYKILSDMLIINLELSGCFQVQFSF